jgi:hypothetical protein
MFHLLRANVAALPLRMRWSLRSHGMPCQISCTTTLCEMYRVSQPDTGDAHTKKSPDPPIKTVLLHGIWVCVRTLTFTSDGSRWSYVYANSVASSCDRSRQYHGLVDFFWSRCLGGGCCKVARTRGSCIHEDGCE